MKFIVKLYSDMGDDCSISQDKSTWLNFKIPNSLIGTKFRKGNVLVLSDSCDGPHEVGVGLPAITVVDCKTSEAANPKKYEK